jgi:hypothetical protein
MPARNSVSFTATRHTPLFEARISGAAQVLSYEVVSERLNVSRACVNTLIHHFRKRYSEILRVAVAQTVTDPSEIDDEIRRADLAHEREKLMPHLLIFPAILAFIKQEKDRQV